MRQEETLRPRSVALRDYQQEMIERLEKAWSVWRSVMLQMPTGTGKTVVMAEIIRRYAADTAHGGVLIVAHRRELLDQIRRTVASFGIDAAKERIAVESIQKLSRGGNTAGELQPALVVIDEAHHALARTYRTLWERWPEAKFLGMTATPCRMNSAGFGDLFEALIQSHPIQAFIKAGWLSDFDYVTAEPDNPVFLRTRRLTRRGADGDYQTKEMAMVMDCEESVENLWQAYRQYARGKKGIVYAIDRGHAEHIAEHYRRQGVNCCRIEAATPTAERDRMVEDYRAGRIDVVVNVDILGEGADFPEVEFIQLARPTLSLSRYLQQVGRGMRIARGKDRVIILDHVGLYQAFGLPTEERDWQRMFEGSLAGKAGACPRGLLFVGDGEGEKELADVHMVRIKRKEDAHTGLEVFLQDGLYGIALDGRVIHRALFEHVRRGGKRYFALCTYPWAVYWSRVTVIDRSGRDLGLQMYGKVEWDGDAVLKGSDREGHPLYWDGKYNSYYHEAPTFVNIGGIEMTRLHDGYVLRKQPALVRPTGKQDIYYNHRIVWMNDWLMTKGPSGGADYQPQQILAYGYDCFYVKTGRADLPEVTVIDTLGNVVGRCTSVPSRDSQRTPPRWRGAQLTNASD